jgi:hypothetical protein
MVPVVLVRNCEEFIMAAGGGDLNAVAVNGGFRNTIKISEIQLKYKSSPASGSSRHVLQHQESAHKFPQQDLTPDGLVTTFCQTAAPVGEFGLGEERFRLLMISLEVHGS